ncbi:rho GTPase-activating protein 19 [Eucyclogobius newberryi]|uniref:rho GTPase-activating protein 19 n=1 Tax=Eucyclogobius newberryi TaxID=166745 RepID=UPI003B59EFA2
MAAGKDVNENTRNKRGAVTIATMPPADSAPRAPLVFNPDFFVEKLRHESPDVFLEVVLSNVTRLIDLPGTEFSLLLGDDGPKTPTGTNAGFFRSFNFLKRKDKGVLFGTQLNESCIAQIYQLIEFLSRNLQVEGLFRVPGNSVRQQTLRELLGSGAEVDWSSGQFHPNDVASLLKSLLGELPEPLLTHRHFHAHLKIADMTLFDEHGNKTSAPNKERQIESLQLLFLLLPPTNRSLLKLLLDLLYHTAKLQDKNKMSTFNLALMFAPHVLWPKHMNANDLKDNLKKLNSCMAFLIKHSQKLFRAPGYLRDYAKQHFTGTSVLQSKDDLELLCLKSSPGQRKVQKRTAMAAALAPEHCASPSSQYTEDALKELFRHVNNNMPDSAKKKKLVRQLGKQTGTPTSDCPQDPSGPKKHPRSRSFGGLIKRKNRGEQLTAERTLRHISPEASTRARRKTCKENVLLLQAVNTPSAQLLGRAGLVVKNPDFKENVLKTSRASPLMSHSCFSPRDVSL